MTETKKLKGFEHFCKLKEDYLNICYEVNSHNYTHNQESHENITKVNYKELYEIAQKYPEAKNALTTTRNINYIFSTKDLMNKIHFKKNLTGQQSRKNKINFLKDTNNNISLFIINIIEFESYMFSKAPDSLYYTKGDSFIFFKGFSRLKVSFRDTEEYIKNKNLFDNLLSSLYYSSNKTNPNIRNYIFHEPNKNIFDINLEKRIIKFNDNFEILRNKGILK